MSTIWLMFGGPLGIREGHSFHSEIWFSSGEDARVQLYGSSWVTLLSDVNDDGVGPVWVHSPQLAQGFEIRLLGFSTEAHIDVYGEAGLLRALTYAPSRESVLARDEGPWSRLEIYAGPGDRIGFDSFKAELPWIPEIFVPRDGPFTPPPPAVPEPGTGALLAAGLVFCSLWRRRCR